MVGCRRPWVRRTPQAIAARIYGWAGPRRHRDAATFDDGERVQVGDLCQAVAKVDGSWDANVMPLQEPHRATTTAIRYPQYTYLNGQQTVKGTVILEKCGGRFFASFDWWRKVASEIRAGGTSLVTVERLLRVDVTATERRAPLSIAAHTVVATVAPVHALRSLRAIPVRLLRSLTSSTGYGACIVHDGLLQSLARIPAQEGSAELNRNPDRSPATAYPGDVAAIRAAYRRHARLRVDHVYVC